MSDSEQPTIVLLAEPSRSGSVVSDGQALAKMALGLGESTARVITTALSGGLQLATVTAVLYGWGRAYLQGYLLAFRTSPTLFQIGFADILFAPLSSVLSASLYLTAGVCFIGLIAAYAALGGRGAAALVASGRGSRVGWLRRLTVWFFGRESTSKGDAAVERRSALLVGQGLLFLGALMLVIAGATAAGKDGESDGKKQAGQCQRADFGTTTLNGRTVNFCARLGDAALFYDAASNTWATAKWDAQVVSRTVK